MTEANEKTKCPFCGFEFDAGEGTRYCVSCPVSRNCRLVRCPNCAYETPAEPRLLAAIRKLRRKP